MRKSLLQLFNPGHAPRAAAVLLLLIISSLIFSGCERHARSAEKPAAPAATAPEVIEVTTATATASFVPKLLQATGSFIAQETSDIAPATSGTVSAVYINTGDFVNQGSVIARLDDRDAQLHLQQAQAGQQQAIAALRQAQARIGIGPEQSFQAGAVPEVAAAKANYEAAQAQARLAETNANRYASLVNTGDVSRSVYDQAHTQSETAKSQARAAHEQYENAINLAKQNNQGIATAQAAVSGARAQAAIAQKAVNDTVIRAPFAGYITDRPTAVGEFVNTQSKIATIAQINPLKLNLQVPESEAGQVHTGMAVTAEIAAYPDRKFAGKIISIIPAVDPTSRALIVQVIFDNGDNLLHPGMFATAQVVLPGGQQVVNVPSSAVVRNTAANSAFVYVIENNLARARVVQADADSNGMVAIKSGLTGNEVVATTNLDKLYDGATVVRK